VARIYRDAYGVPHVRADSVIDLAHGQGEVTARDRAWQLEWLRRRATGTTEEVFGEPAVEWDRFAHATLIAETAQRAHAALGEESRAFVGAYVAGVNAGLHADAPELVRLGIEPQPWPEWMPLAVFHAQHILFAGLGSLLWSRWAEEVLGVDAVLLEHEEPTGSGSNAWAVGGGRTASGRPLIGGDPHRVIESPGVYQQIRLACDEFDVVGFAFPGVPGTPHFAHAGDVAWAITNAMSDYQDLSDDPADPEFEDGLRMRNASTVLGDLGFEALLPLLRSRTVDDVDRALDHWVEPVNNAVIADRHGAVRYRLAGRVPVRDGTAWTGWLTDVHREEVGPDGQVVTANERRGPQSAAVGSSFAPPYRARRLHQLLDGRTGLTPEDFRTFHNDTLLQPAEELRRLVPGEFDDWDCRMDADSSTAAAFAAWRSALVRRIAAEPVFAPLHEPRHSPLFAPWLDVTTRIALALPNLAAAGTPYGIDVAGLARLALDDSREHPPTWGDTHVVTPVHAFELHGMAPPAVPALPVSGDSDCVRCTGSYPGQTDECYRGSVARYVWDLADRQASGWVVPMGADGDPRGAHHHDQLEAWAVGDLVPIVTDWERLTEER
jgi:penicillin G amidase